MSLRSVSGSRSSRRALGALTISVLSVMIAALLAFTAVSLATLICRAISADPSADFGTAVETPASTERAAAALLHES